MWRRFVLWYWYLFYLSFFVGIGCKGGVGCLLSDQSKMLELWRHPFRDASLSCVTTKLYRLLGLIWIIQVRLRVCASRQVWSTCWFRRRKACGTPLLWTKSCFLSFVDTLLDSYCVASMMIPPQEQYIGGLKMKDHMVRGHLNMIFFLFTELQSSISNTNQLFHHLHDCKSRVTQIF